MTDTRNTDDHKDLAPEEDVQAVLKDELEANDHEAVADDEDLHGRPRHTAGATGTNAKMQARIDELTGDLQRLQAEFSNFKRRESDARAEIMNLAKEEVVLQLLPLLDNVDRALGHRPQELADNAWAAGVEQVGKQAQSALQKLGVAKIEAVGQAFDHNLHEAVGYEEGEGDQEVVTDELQPGYKIGDRVIRHAMVRVKKTNQKRR